MLSRLWFCFCHKSFFLSIWYAQLPSNKVATVRTVLLSMTNSALSCFVHEELMCKSLSVEKCLLSLNLDQLHKLMKEESKRNNGGTLQQFGPVFSKKERKLRHKSKFTYEYVARCFSKVRLSLAFYLPSKPCLFS